ncbi:MAG: peptidyl-prolyl cis-trans isomerase [Sedimentisphaerales bacterium]|nr:peptidyl-prolyl cis-trans isomerase [Sedimentisphaerales bacterium]
MEEKLDFSLPEKKPRNMAGNWILIVLLLILIGLTAINLTTKPTSQGLTPDVAGRSFSPEQTKQLAAKLAQRNLHQRAAKVWEDYLAVGTLTDTERARTLFLIGTLLEKANLYDQAIEYFYRSEAIAELDELKPQISAHIKDCFEKIGSFSALRYEMMDRTSLEASPTAGAKVVAEIGAEKITEADLDAAIENDIENQLEPMASFMTAEQFNKQKKRMLDQYKHPQTKQQYLQSWLAQELLYRQALEDGLAEKPEAKKLINQLTRSALSQLLMNNELASKINITETDLQTFYSANKDNYIDPAKAAISHILVDDEQQAKDLIERIKNSEDFAELAKQFSKDESTKQTGGKIDTEVQKGSYIPGIGTNDQLNEKIFAAEPPKVLDEPFKTDKGFEIVKVESITPERQMSFDEVRQQVMTTLANQKRQDVQRDYIKQMMDKYNVIIHTSAFGNAQENESETEK